MKLKGMVLVSVPAQEWQTTRREARFGGYGGLKIYSMAVA
jgi:hypothetical protein